MFLAENQIFGALTAIRGRPVIVCEHIKDYVFTQPIVDINKGLDDHVFVRNITEDDKIQYVPGVVSGAKGVVLG